MKRHSDLAVEHFGFSSPSHAEPFRETITDIFPVLTASLPEGCYHTVISGKIWLESAEVRRRFVRAAAEVFDEILPSRRRILFAGIGNADIPSDALGAKVCRRILVTGESAVPPSVFAVQPGTQSRTGIDTARIIRCIADEIRPDVILVTDALAAKSPERLHTVLQISDAGIIPGSAASHTAEEISSRTMPCPVISLGVPTVISTAALIGEAEEEPLFVTRADSDIITDCWASIIGGIVNTAVFGK